MKSRVSRVAVLAVLAAMVCPSVCTPADGPTADSAPTYRIYPLRNGTCQIAGNNAFHGGNNAETYEYTVYYLQNKALCSYACAYAK